MEVGPKKNTDQERIQGILNIRGFVIHKFTAFETLESSIFLYFSKQNASLEFLFCLIKLFPTTHSAVK